MQRSTPPPGYVSDWGYSLQFRTADDHLIQLWQYAFEHEHEHEHKHEHEWNSPYGNALADYDGMLARLKAENHSRTNDALPLNRRVIFVMENYRDWLQSRLSQTELT